MKGVWYAKVSLFIGFTAFGYGNQKSVQSPDEDDRKNIQG